MRVLILLVLAVVVDSTVAAAQVSWRSHREPDCSVVLTDAVGVPNAAEHHYRFRGTCQTYRRWYKDGQYHHRDAVGPIQLVRIDGGYDRDDGLYEEVIRVESPAEGQIRLTFQCPADPVYQAANCRLHRRDDRTYEPADPEGVWVEIMAPVLGRKASLADATAKSEAEILAAEARERERAEAEVRAGTLVQGSTVGGVAPGAPVGRLPTPGVVTGASAPRTTGAAIGVVVPLSPDARIALEDGSYLAGSVPNRRRSSTATWHHLDRRGGLIRAFPDGSVAYRQAERRIVVVFDGAVTHLGVERSP